MYDAYSSKKKKLLSLQPGYFRLGVIDKRKDLFADLFLLYYSTMCYSCDRTVVANAAHFHAKVFALCYHERTLYSHPYKLIGYLLCKPLLYLEPARILFNQPYQFRYTKYLAGWNIGNMYLSKEWQHVVFAHAVELYVLCNDGLCLFRKADVQLGIHPITSKYLFIHASYPVWSACKTFPVRVLAKLYQ